jgi:hypothetical protein
MKLKISLLILLLAVIVPASAQKNEAQKAFFTGTVASVQHIPSLASREYLEPADVTPREAKDRRSGQNNVIIGKDPQTENDRLASNPHPLTGKIKGRDLLFDFEATASGSSPSDPAGAVGPNHYLSVFNTGFRIFDKAGTPLTGQLNVNNIFSNGGCCDLTASYDSAADRWVLTYLFSSNGQMQVGVSDGPDPVASGWYVYTIPNVQDYNKLSVWSDGYYVTANKSGSPKVWALERDEMLLGNPAAQVQGFNLPGLVTSGFYSPQAFNVTDDVMPAAGGAPIVYLQDDAWGGVAVDHIKLWTIDVDWVTPANSTISAANQIVTTPFISVFDGGSFSNLSQPGGGADIDALQATIMNQAQFRKFGGHNSAVFNFVVDTDAGGGELAGIRWIELRQPADNQPWVLFQEGTHLSPEGKHAWHASLAMDVSGNIGMGYTAMAGPTTPNPTTKRVSSYYTGRFAGDPAGTMTVAETLIQAGTTNIPNFRYGDYSKIDVDPSDDRTFWFINEIAKSGRKDHVGVFQIQAALNNDVGAISVDAPVDGPLTNAEPVTVTIFNYGLDPQVNIPVNLTIDAVNIADEIFVGPLAPATSAQYTFIATGDFSIPSTTYAVTVTTNLGADQDNANDSVTQNVMNTSLGTEDNIAADAELLLLNRGKNKYEVKLNTTAVSETLTLTVTNMLGQTLLSRNLESNGQGYVYDLDMSYAAAGTYIVRLGNRTSGNSKRLIVE